MCGIVGIVGFPDRRDLDHVVAGMVEALTHRGPDDSGVWSDVGAGVALGHRRLSIVDLSPAGHQPMTSACGRFVLTFNGEIYNHREIRYELEGAGAAPAWRGHSDTEVFLAAVGNWGVQAALEKSVGMFAFGLWDRHNRTLHLARDRLGEKPLYLGAAGSSLIFASELKALRACPGWSGSIDRGALAEFMRFGCISSPRSIYADVVKIPPASLMSIPCEDPGAMLRGADPSRAERYWDVVAMAEAGIADPLIANEAEAQELLAEKLDSAISLQMEADVPLGSFLSGGIDSSLVTALMQARSGQNVKTFSIGFEDPAYNEAIYAKAVARHLGTEHTEEYLTADDAMAVIPRLPALYDEPFADASQIPTFLVSEVARRHVTVALSGDAGDELFGGYNRHRWIGKLFSSSGAGPALRYRLLGNIAGQIAAAGGDNRLQSMLPKRYRAMQLGDRMSKLGSVFQSNSPEDAYLAARSLWASPDEIVLGATEPPLSTELASNRANLDGVVHGAMFRDLISYLPDDILVKVDRAAMGVSLETRVPLLDHRLVEFAWRLPLSMKIRDGKGKWLLRQILYEHVPRELIERPKSGFSLPIHEWLRGPLRDWAEDLLDENDLEQEGFFEPGLVRRRWEEHRLGRRNWQHQIWCVLMFQAWLSESVGNQSAFARGDSGSHGVTEAGSA